MKQYQGAVFFVDMLGVGALTQNQVTLGENDFTAWGMSPSSPPSANLFCGQLLTEFRSCLAAVSASHKQVKIAQLSDCAYIWSENVLAVMDAARAFMWSSVSVGLLSRGGISYGEIVEPNKINRAIGQFILGSAVTQAVGLEKAGKGCRIFVDNIIHERSISLHNSPFKNGAVKALKNPLDGSVVKEFCWYKSGGRSGNWQNEQHIAAEKIITLVTQLQYSPRFSWNDTSPQGRIQLACSIDSISDATPDFIGNGNYIFKGEEYLLQFRDNQERSALACQRVLNERLKDIDRFFINGKQKDIMDRWLELNNDPIV
ncbi:hypothetical protein C9422_09755 [Pseudomonas sp. B1(2018)]|uniref:hypothetical protein n=1 Tax=Pseudomonas sp. B1(2018) TaxID=2233856 RepID=UPI000D5F4AF9|nr:hypothetical protein [Pseudomonas sp. B1(2018)]PVZ59228.1 hypothetical protein C9422_09755 [Pseudomonas sp. B1(2018)]